MSYYIMRNDDMQVSRMCLYLVHNHLPVAHPHLAQHMIQPTCHMSRRDHMHDYDYCMCNRDRNRRSWARRDRWVLVMIILYSRRDCKPSAHLMSRRDS